MDRTTLLLVLAMIVPALSQAPSEERKPMPTKAPSFVLGPNDQGTELLGTMAPALDGVTWLDGKPHPLSEDAGKVVLVRWWTVDCPFCVNTAPALRALAKKHGDDLAIRAIFHPKPVPAEVPREEVVAATKTLGMPGTVGFDPEWAALQRWWLTGEKRRFTSVSFLLDRGGRIRVIHSGGEYHLPDHLEGRKCKKTAEACADEWQRIDRAIEELRAEEKTAEGSAGR